MARMYNPPHPGEILREDVLPALGLTISEAAEQLDLTRPALSRVLNGKAAISTELALKLEKWLGEDRGGSADVWLKLQLAWDLWQKRAEVRSGRGFKVRVARARTKEAAADGGHPAIRRREHVGA